MIFNHVLILLVFLIEGISSSRKISYLWTLDPQWSDRLTAVVPSWTKQTTSLTTCSMVCLSNAFCVSFFYHNQTQQCQGHDLYLTDTTGSTVETGWSYYSVTCKGNDYTFVREFNTCYKVYMTGIPWNDANNICLNDGGYMINLPEMDKYNYFINLLQSNPSYNTKFWIGLTDIGIEGQYVWTKAGTEVSSTASVWQAGQPDNGNGLQDCVQLTVSSGTLDDFTCGGTKNFICESEPV